MFAQVPLTRAFATARKCHNSPVRKLIHPVKETNMGIGASILLLAVGAILAFAVTIDPTPFAGMTIQWDTVGVILMIVGVIGLVWSIFALNAWRDRNRVVETTPVDNARVVETRRDVY
jgi:hypothetical protein